jgi:23S rRNA (guanosine2251-2'-O)-methyltransferase
MADARTLIVFGINPVLEALRAGRVRTLRVGERADARMQQVIDLAGRGRVPVRRVDDATLDRDARGGVHQGVIAEVASAPAAGVDDLVQAARDAGATPLVVVLDGIEDPHNVGAILRTADAAGVHGIVRQERRAAPLDAAAAKASAGAVAWVRVADVVNIARAIEALKALGVWTVGLAADAPRRYDEIDFRQPTAIVLGSEGSGLRRLVRERCDLTAHIPMAGHVESLNVSVAAGIVLFEAMRQRRLDR